MPIFRDFRIPNPQDIEFFILRDLYPQDLESYVHRIGRTGRAKKSGLAISFCNIEERAYLKDIQKLIDQKIPVVTKHSFADEVEEMPTKKKPTRGQRNFNKPLKRTKDSDNKANRSKDKRERNKNNSNNNNEIRTFGESKNQNTKFNSRRRNKKW